MLEAYLQAQQSSEALALQAFVRQFHFVPKTFFITTAICSHTWSKVHRSSCDWTRSRDIIHHHSCS